MAIDDLPLEGGCRCGQVRFRVSKPPMLTMACHCRGCQQMTSSAYALTAVIPSEAFEVIQGEPVIGGLHGPQAHHHFCPHCMSWLFTRAEGMDWFVNVRPGLLDDPRWTEPFADIWTREKLPWVVPSSAHAYPETPGWDEFQQLTKAYAAHGA